MITLTRLSYSLPADPMSESNQTKKPFLISSQSKHIPLRHFPDMTTLTARLEKNQLKT